MRPDADAPRSRTRCAPVCGTSVPTAGKADSSTSLPRSRSIWRTTTTRSSGRDDRRRSLVARLRVEAWYADARDEAAAHAVEGPLVIIGTGRSGTTATHYLLAVDPQFRYPRKWELIDPVPPPDAATEHRILAAPMRRSSATSSTSPRWTDPRRTGGSTSCRSTRVRTCWVCRPTRSTGAPLTTPTAFPYHERILRSSMLTVPPTAGCSRALNPCTHCRRSPRSTPTRAS